MILNDYGDFIDSGDFSGSADSAKTAVIVAAYHLL